MSKTILIVEDNDLNRKQFNDLLESQDYSTVLAENVKNAMDLAREHKPDLILMDIQLPEISGFSAIETLKSDDKLKDIPVVVVTAFAMKEMKERAFEAGCEAYITKPISVPNFLETVAKHIG